MKIQTNIDGVERELELRDLCVNSVGGNRPEIFKNVTSSSAILPRYQDYMVKEYCASQNRDHSFHHPSSFGYCGRKNILDFYNYRDKNIDKREYLDYRIIEIFGTGHITHAKFQKKFSKIFAPEAILYGWWKCIRCKNKMGRDQPLGIPRPNGCPSCGLAEVDDIEYVEVGMEASKESGYNVKGHCDAIVKLSPSHEFQVVDFKTCSNFSFNMRVEQDCPVESHVVQLNAYMWLLGLNAGYILYENRDKMTHKEFFVKRDEYIIDRIKNQLLFMNQAIKEGSVPDPKNKNFIISSDIGPLGNQCRGYMTREGRMAPCKYYHICYKPTFDSEGGSMIYKGKVEIKNV